MKIRLFALLLTFATLCCSNAFAVPAAPVEFDLTQPDGTVFTAIQRGDEYANWIETLEGLTVVKVMDTWYYAESDNQGGIRATTMRVGSLSAAERQKLPLHVAPLPHPDAFRLRNPRKIPRGTGEPGSKFAQIKTISHSQRVVTILVDYTDQSFSHSDASFQNLMYGPSGSVKEFFLENSYGGFTVTPATENQGVVNDGVIHISRGVAHPNPGKGDATAEARAIVEQTDPFIDYASYDTNGDNSISVKELSILIIMAGYEASFGPLTPSVWGHAFRFPQLTLDGVNLAPYTVFGELQTNNPSQKLQATIGIMCHELGHLMLDLPDLYDSDDSSAGIGNWGLMGGGSWNANGGRAGTSPAHMSAWSKVRTNFTAAQDINSNQAGVSLAKADANEVAKRIWVDKYKLNEYFLVENRQQSGYDAGLAAGGLLIWHVDDSQTDNTNENRKWVDLEAADGKTDLDSKTNNMDDGDPFPGSSNNTSFDDSSTPNSKAYSGAATQIGVTSISAPGATMTADFNPMSGDLGNHLRYDENGVTGAGSGFGNPTIWVGIRALNNTTSDMLDGVEVYVRDNAGATVDVYFYNSMAGGTPTGLIHSQTGFNASAGWNRLLLTTPQSFPNGTERGVVLKIVNNSSNFPISYDDEGQASGRSYVSPTGSGTFQAMCPNAPCGDLNVVALLGGGGAPPSCYALTRSHTGSGADPTAIPASSSGCTNGEYTAGESINVTANPDGGWNVGSWQGTNNDGSTSTSNSLTMPAGPHTVTVHYTEVPVGCYVLTLTHSGSGSDPVATPGNSDSCPGGSYVSGESINLSASPAGGWSVGSWEGTADDGSTSTSNQVTMPAGAHTVKVNYKGPGGGGGTEVKNLSTRADVGTGPDIAIAGFIVAGNEEKCVVVRGRGPSMAVNNVPKLMDPNLTLYSGQTIIASNDDWGSQDDPAHVAIIQNLGLAPPDFREAAVYMCLPNGPFTGLLRGGNGGTGVGIVEVFDADDGSAILENISTRARVGSGPLVTIAGFIIEGSEPKKILLRGRGPTVGVPAGTIRLRDPRLRLYQLLPDNSNVLLEENDDWQQGPNAAEIAASGQAPGDSLEAATLRMMEPGVYTGILDGGPFGFTGSGIIEVIDLSAAPE
jgi:M6 family metalloprotease-like protein